MRSAGLAAGIALLAAMASGGAPAPGPAPVAIDYPLDGAVFPPEFPPPTFLFRDSAPAAAAWAIEVRAPGLAAPIRASAKGERLRLGEIDSRAISPSIGPPVLTARQKATRTWTPARAAWEAIKTAATAQPAVITVTGCRDTACKDVVSRGRVSIRASTDPVGAPVFYRDVPLMPSETEPGVIKPLAANAMPLIAWRLRDIAETRSRVVMEGLHSCANCHSFSGDGQWMGLDVDGPLNDKGLYAILPVRPAMSLRNEDLIAWSSFQGRLGGKLRVGFMSQVSPAGRYVVTTINDNSFEQSDYQRRKQPRDLISNYYVANFKDYRFLQVFYPTRGILAWYDRAGGVLQPLPGADDPTYVHTGAVWSPDGQYLVFSRAPAKDPVEPGRRPAERANDPNEIQIRFDLYRIPFNGGRGGKAEPVPGASGNGMSNSFPKISPDGKWIVWVQARNGQLMRPDSVLWIVPAAGGVPRRMTCNTPLMNSWHSFSPNGRWMVFSSKSRSPYTRMFLTHLDPEGNDSPPVMIENQAAENRAVNIPEFVNIAPGGMVRIEAPAADYFRAADLAAAVARGGSAEEAAAAWARAIALGPADVTARYNYANALSRAGRIDEAISEYGKTLELSPDHSEALNNLGTVLKRRGRLEEAMASFAKALALDEQNGSAHTNLGAALIEAGRPAEALEHLRRAVELKPGDLDAQNNLGLALAVAGDYAAAVAPLEEAVRISKAGEALILDLLAKVYAETGRFADAARAARRGLEAARRQNRAQLTRDLEAALAGYEARMKR